MTRVIRRNAGVFRASIIVAVLLPVAAAGLRAEDERVADGPEVAANPQQQGNLVDLGMNFDSNVFAPHGGISLRAGVIVARGGAVRISPTGIDQVAELSTLARARERADKRLDRIDRLCGLTDSQRLTLRLAMESDIRRLVERIDAERSKYVGVIINMADPQGQKTWQRFQQDMHQCRRLILGLFDTGSLFASVLASTLDAEQGARFVAETRARRAFRWRGITSSVLTKLDDMLGLSQEQHAALERQLLAHEPSLRIDGGPQQRNAHAEQMLVYLVLSRVDQKLLESAVSPRQWRSLAMLVNQGKAMQSWLEQQNLLETPGLDR